MNTYWYVWYCGMCHPRHIFAVTAPLHIPHRVVITFLHLFISTCDCMCRSANGIFQRFIWIKVLKDLFPSNKSKSSFNFTWITQRENLLYCKQNLWTREIWITEVMTNPKNLILTLLWLMGGGALCARRIFEAFFSKFSFTTMLWYLLTFNIYLKIGMYKWFEVSSDDNLVCKNNFGL